MQTMLERISEAEQQADQLIEQANTAARERIAKAKEEAEVFVASAQDKERSKTSEVLETAKADGDREADAILSSVRKDIAAVREQACNKIPDALAYLSERIEHL